MLSHHTRLPRLRLIAADRRHPAGLYHHAVRRLLGEQPLAHRLLNWSGSYRPDYGAPLAKN
jgi:hypothetical protein